MNYKASLGGGSAGVATVLLITAVVHYATGNWGQKTQSPPDVHYHQGIAHVSPPGYAAGYFDLGTNTHVPTRLLPSVAQMQGSDFGGPINSFQSGLNSQGSSPMSGMMGSMPAPVGMRAIAMTQPIGQATPVMQGEMPPELVRKLGMEVLPTESGKVIIAGVMERSRAARGGLQRNDIILRVNDTRVQGLAQFQTLMLAARNERVAPITVLREGEVKRLLVKIGEGDMDGVGPIMAQGMVLPVAPPAAFAAPGVEGVPQ